MNDVVSIQQALFHGLRSCNLFDPVNIVLGREFYVNSEIKMDSLWMTQREGPNGRTGLGIIIQMPTLRFPKPNGLQRQREFSIGIYEERNINFTPDLGTMTTCEDWGDLVVDFLWNWRLWRSSGLILDDAALVPDTRFKSIGIAGQVAKALLRQERKQPARPTPPVIDITDPNNVTLTADVGAQIYYTTDGASFPGPSNEGKIEGEEAALLYTAPFAAASGTIIMAVAYQDGLLPSQLVDAQIP